MKGEVVSNVAEYAGGGPLRRRLGRRGALRTAKRFQP